MANVEKRPYEVMFRVASQMMAKLSPACERIVIAGSLRRREDMVGDIEIVAVPKLLRDLFQQDTGRSEVDVLLEKWPLEMLANGPKQKKFIFTSSQGSRYQVDLFLQPDPATWAVNLMLRTGSADFSHWLVTKRNQGGAMWDDCSSRGARIYHQDQVLDLPNEEDVFRFLHIAFIPPHLRKQGAWHTFQAQNRPMEIFA